MGLQKKKRHHFGRSAPPLHVRNQRPVLPSILHYQRVIVRTRVMIFESSGRRGLSRPDGVLTWRERKQ